MQNEKLGVSSTSSCASTLLVVHMVIVLPMPTYMHLHVVPFLILHESPSHACVFSRFVRMRAAYRTIASRAFGRC